MKAVIPYRQDAANGEELRYAIRSLVKYFKPLTEVIVVGDAPDWYTGAYIPYADTPGRKEFSIYSKLMQVQGTVLYSNDDYFALRAFNETLPNYCNGICRHKHSHDKQYKELFANCPGEWTYFDVHTPMIIDTTKFVWDIDRPIKTYYANQNGLAGIRLADCKLKFEMGYSEIKSTIADRPFFSTDGNVTYKGFQQVLKELYPEKSKYEV